jgi:hypothetical protein
MDGITIGAIAPASWRGHATDSGRHHVIASRITATST